MTQAIDTTPAQATDITPEQRAQAKRAVIASSVGNALEWFDIIVYASFAVVISTLFFPSTDGITGLLLVFGTFALSYLIRPLGAMVLGNYGDTAGRKKALTLTIMLMTIGTGIMAFAPTAASIGAWAGAVILVSRLLQGFSAGGEFGAAGQRAGGRVGVASRPPTAAHLPSRCKPPSNCELWPSRIARRDHNSQFSSSAQATRGRLTRDPAQAAMRIGAQRGPAARASRLSSVHSGQSSPSDSAT